jgi:hypothetical protein
LKLTEPKNKNKKNQMKTNTKKTHIGILAAVAAVIGLAFSTPEAGAHHPSKSSPASSFLHKKEITKAPKSAHMPGTSKTVRHEVAPDRKSRLRPYYQRHTGGPVFAGSSTQ